MHIWVAHIGFSGIKNMKGLEDGQGEGDKEGKGCEKSYGKD